MYAVHQPAETGIYASAAFEVDPAHRELRVHGVPVPIGGRAFEIIEVLVRSAGELISKDELIRRVWAGAVVEDNTLHVLISAVRKALGPARAMLKTESGRGYRMLGSWTTRAGHARAEALTPAPADALLPSNLPTPGSELIGRAAAVRQLQELLSAYRVVTLTGPGGIGKSILALEVARDLSSGLQGNAWLVELVSLSDPALVPSTAAAVLGLKGGGSEVSAQSVARMIGRRKALLVLDNCEHLVGAAANLAETIVRLCPHATILATSRETLRIDGERLWRVPPLDVPTSDQDAPRDVLDYGAVRLFVARLSAAHSGMSAADLDLRTIAAICRRLDGIPLAIEFAAARAAALGPEHVLSRLDDRFAMLTTGRRTALPRHRTLRAALDWSYELLPEEERRLLRRLAVFAGGFTIDGAVAVMRDTSLSVSDVVNAIASLIAKSLVTPDGSEPRDRWRLLETIRAYALEKLAERGEAGLAARRHAEFFRDFVLPAMPASLAEPSTEGMSRYGREIDNVRGALDWAFSPGGDASLGVALTAAAIPLWMHLSLLEECRSRVERALAIFAPAPAETGATK